MNSAQAINRTSGDMTPPTNPSWSLGFRSLPLKSLEMFCQRLSVGLGAGVDILRLLDTERKQSGQRQQLATADMALRIRRGESLAQSMQAQEGLFPKLLVQMVDAGESGGGLDRIFGHMAEHYRDLRNARNVFLQQISWPAVQLMLALIVISGVILLQGLLSPASAETAYDASGLGLRGWGGFVFFWIVVLIMMAGLATLALGIWKNWFQSHRILVPWIRNIPVIGTVFATMAMSRMSMTLSMLLNAGVDVKRCVREAFKSTGNFYYLSGMQRALDQVERGQSLAHSFEASAVLPKEFVEAIEIGELSGTETDSLERLAAEYKARSKIALQTLATSTSVTIWVCIALFLIFMIITMAMQYVNMLYSFMP